MVVDREDNRDIEKGLGSVGKIKILRLLMKQPNHAFTRYEIGRKVSNDPVSIRNDLKTFVQIQWVTEFKIQHISKYILNLDNPTVKRLMTFLQEIHYL